VVTYETLNQIMDKNEEHPDKQIKILDARFKNPFDKGHIPSSVSLPFPEVLNADKTFKPK
jgi:3-mercaptopyruvate sulfurtransferase SseA